MDDWVYIGEYAKSRLADLVGADIPRWAVGTEIVPEGNIEIWVWRGYESTARNALRNPMTVLKSERETLLQAQACVEDALKVLEEYRYGSYAADEVHRLLTSAEIVLELGLVYAKEDVVDLTPFPDPGEWDPLGQGGGG